MRQPAIRLTSHDDLPEEAGLVGDGLDAANAAAAPLDQVRPLCCLARGGGDEVLGGAVGRTWGACAELGQLWVQPERRRQGIGAALVRAFEEQAAGRGCSTIYLETFSFQAPALYRTLGYEVRAAIDGFAPGVTKYLMVRELSAPAPARPVQKAG